MEVAMTIQREPHPVFASLWALLLVNALVACVTALAFPWGPWHSLGALAAMGVLEWVAVKHKSMLRDSLSELTTWVNRKLSKEWEDGRGWNTLVAIQAFTLGWLIFVTALGFGGIPGGVFGLVVGFWFGRGQYDHWGDPTRWG